MGEDATLHERIEIPDQDVSALFDNDGAILPCVWPANIAQFTATDKAPRTDRDTDVAIGAAMHPFASRGEEAAIHREQIQALLDKLGMKPTEKFALLAKIADKAVTAGQTANPHEGLVEINTNENKI
jgi:hypothetical protein